MAQFTNPSLHKSREKNIHPSNLPPITEELQNIKRLSGAGAFRIIDSAAENMFHSVMKFSRYFLF